MDSLCPGDDKISQKPILHVHLKKFYSSRVFIKQKSSKSSIKEERDRNKKKALSKIEKKRNVRILPYIKIVME